jgi:predicted nucleic acid-binding protein
VILVDTNVLIDLVTDDPVWAEWSQRQLRAAAATDELAINEAVFAELSVRYAVIEQVETMLERVRAIFVPTPQPALFLAGKAFQRYRAAGGIRTGVLPDFFLGAHAQVTDSLLLTRDTRRYRTYFPTIALISPED